MSKMLNLEQEIFINQFSQNLHTIGEMQEWFLSYSIQERKNIVSGILNMVFQAHPRYAEIEKAVAVSTHRTSSAAQKLLSRKKPFSKYGHELCLLPEKELSYSFDILLLLLKIADGRRKSEEPSGFCTHWWHQDLSNRQYLQWLKKNL